MGKASGLTLLETILAMGVLAILLTGLSGLFLKLLGSTEKANDLSAGLLVAERVLQEQVVVARFESAPPDKTLLYTHDGQQAMEFLYQVTCSPMQVSPGGAAIYYVDVQVWWSGGQRHGQGQLFTRVGRLITP